MFKELNNNCHLLLTIDQSSKNKGLSNEISSIIMTDKFVVHITNNIYSFLFHMCRIRKGYMYAYMLIVLNIWKMPFVFIINIVNL